MQSESPAGATGSKWTDDPVYGLRRMTLSDEAEGNPTLSDDQLYILRSIALAAASMSMVSGLLVGFWFIRMKRSFRHQYAPCRRLPILPTICTFMYVVCAVCTDLWCALQPHHVDDILGLLQSELAIDIPGSRLHQRRRFERISLLPDSRIHDVDGD